MKRWAPSFTLVTFLLLVFMGRASAYFDPGAGSMMLQVVLGVIFGIFFAIRQRILRFIKKIFGKNPSSGPDGA
jgi:hypothetical protein